MQIEKLHIYTLPDDFTMDSILSLRDWFQKVKNPSELGVEMVSMNRTQFNEFKRITHPFFMKGVVRRLLQNDYLIPCS